MHIKYFMMIIHHARLPIIYTKRSLNYHNLGFSFTDSALKLEPIILAIYSIVKNLQAIITHYIYHFYPYFINIRVY